MIHDYEVWASLLPSSTPAYLQDHRYLTRPGRLHVIISLIGGGFFTSPLFSSRVFQHHYSTILHHSPAAVRKPQRPNSHDLCIVLCCKSHYESVHGLSSVPVRPITVPPDLRSSNVLLCGSLTYAHPRRIAIAHFRDLFLKIG